MDKSEIPITSDGSQRPSDSKDANSTTENVSRKTTTSERNIRHMKPAKRKSSPELFNTPGLPPKKKDSSCWEIVNGTLSSMKRNSCSPNCIIHREEYEQLSEDAVDKKIRLLLKPIFEEYRKTSGVPSSSSAGCDAAFPSAEDMRRMFQHLSLNAENPAYSEIIRKLQSYKESHFYK